MNTTTQDTQHVTAKPKPSGMWFMNSIVNPLMALLLRSPLHGMVSGSATLISVRGRKSGKAYTLPVQYAQVDETIYIVPGAPESKTWWRNLRGGAPVTLWLRGRKLNAQAELLIGEADQSAIVGALDVYYRRFTASARLAHVRQEADGSFNASDLQAAAGQAVVVRIKAR